MKSVGGVIAGIGTVLMLIGIAWAAIGFYSSQVPALLGLLVVGGILAFVGGRMVRGDGRPELPEGARVVAAPPPTPHVDPAVTPVATTAARVPADASAEALAAVAAADSASWPEIERHPAAYPALLEWIAAQRVVAAPGAVAPLADEDLRRAADPATDAGELADIAHRRADLRATVATNPSAYAGLREWIAQHPD